ncbi:hypothetical protein EVAR_11694_1 [Eumeta japonica]|uniref:Uncharacterized protein n=1 Tax=Eumeta variegata TaxID=151549 RepID=A0A4C1U4S5_EUMVA|nr:hypothetical protein EVAR_11694_1 [Eumeta japonica]
MKIVHKQKFFTTTQLQGLNKATKSPEERVTPANGTIYVDVENPSDGSEVDNVAFDAEETSSILTTDKSANEFLTRVKSNLPLRASVSTLNHQSWT